VADDLLLAAAPEQRPDRPHNRQLGYRVHAGRQDNENISERSSEWPLPNGQHDFAG